MTLFLKVVATVAFGMGLDKRDVGAVRIYGALRIVLFPVITAYSLRIFLIC